MFQYSEEGGTKNYKVCAKLGVRSGNLGGFSEGKGEGERGCCRNFKGRKIEGTKRGRERRERGGHVYLQEKGLRRGDRGRYKRGAVRRRKGGRNGGRKMSVCLRTTKAALAPTSHSQRGGGEGGGRGGGEFYTEKLVVYMYCRGE